MGRLTLSLIVKNEEKYLKGCLDSVMGIVDEIILVDTGSTDRTKEIAARYEAKIFDYEWKNDFASARNFALSKTTCDWILYLDADERLSKESIAEVKMVVATDKRLGVNCIVKSTDQRTQNTHSIYYPRLFKYHKAIRFEGKVHEQITQSLFKNGFRIVNSKILINHLGYDIDIEGKKEKAQRNLSILLNEYSELNSDYIAFQLGNTYNTLEDYENAKEFYLKVIDSKNLNRHYVAIAASSLAYISLNEKNFQEAEKYIEKSLTINNHSSYSNLIAAKISFGLNNSEEAIKYSLKSLEVSKSQINSEALSIQINREEVIYFGLMISYLSKNELFFDRFWLELKHEIRNHMNYDKTISYLQQFLSGKKPVTFSYSTFKSIYNNFNSLFILKLLSQLKDIDFRIELFENMENDFSDDNIKKELAKVYSEKGLVEKAIDIFEQRGKENLDASELLYLLSFYLKSGNSEPVNNIIEIIEEKYKAYPQILERIAPLKKRL
ncbi:MAG: glycosyltransferase [Melioribacteraceae bacterium]|nr:glycosyltransferase [Melioribacteraceae bacterium]